MSPLININKSLVFLSLNLFRTYTKSFIGPDLKLRIDGFPKVNQSLELIKLDVVEIFRFDVDDYSRFRIYETVNYLKEIVKTIDFLEECLIICEIFIEKVMR